MLYIALSYLHPLAKLLFHAGLAEDIRHPLHLFTYVFTDTYINIHT